MKTQLATVLILALLATLACVAPASAQESDGESCVVCVPDDGTTNWMDIGGVLESVDGSEASNEQRGVLGSTFLTSGRLHLPKDYWKKNRFEVRWQDITDRTGRVWGRVALYPFTIESNNFLLKNSKWDNDVPLGLIDQEVASDDIKVRWHRGELDNMLVRYQKLEYNYPDVPDTSVQLSRLGVAHNFTLGGGRVVGSWSQTGTNITSPETGVTSGEVNTTAVRMDAKIDETWGLYGRGSYSKLDFDNLADNSMTASDYKVGIRFKPDCRWEFRADMGGKDNPTENAVSSHVDGSNDFSFRVDFTKECDRTLAAGYTHRRVDYDRLNIKDAVVTNLIRQPAVITPAQVAHATDALNPEIDETWVEGRWAFSDKFSSSARVSLTEGDNPTTTISNSNLAGLFYNRRLDRTLNLYYNANPDNQFAFLFKMNESVDNDRGNSYDLRYIQGSWSRCIGTSANLALIVSNTDSELGSTVPAGYTTDEMSYGLNFSKQLHKFDYALDMAYTNGKGFDEYKQTQLGADFSFKCLGPLSLRLDWFDRRYDSQPDFNTTATEFTLRYRIDL